MRKIAQKKYKSTYGRQRATQGQMIRPIYC